MSNLDDYEWESFTARRSTADIAWQYGIDLHGSTSIPTMFRRLEYQPDPNRCAMLGEPTEYSVDSDYPATFTSITAYSYGYYLKNPVLYNFRQTKAGIDIPAWERAGSNYKGETSRTNEIVSYENPSYLLKRMLWPLDANGNITSERGYYNLYMARLELVPNWGGVVADTNHQTVETKQFFFDGSKTIIDVIDEIAEHCGMIYFTKFKKVGTEWREYFYWIPKYRLQEDKGNYLELPTTITQITQQTESLVGQPGISATVGLEDSFNAVMVEACRTKDSAWFYGYAEKPEVTNGTEIKRVLQFRTDSLLPDPVANTWTSTITVNSNYGPGGVSYGTATENANCQALVNNKAAELLQYANYVIPSYSAAFKDTYFELYQRVQFIGFPNIPQDVMRITEIEYQYNPPDDQGMICTITCSKATTLQESGKFQSIIDEIQANYEKLKESASDTADTQKIGVVISTYQDNSMATVQLRSSGAIIKTRSYGFRKAPT